MVVHFTLSSLHCFSQTRSGKTVRSVLTKILHGKPYRVRKIKLFSLFDVGGYGKKKNNGKGFFLSFTDSIGSKKYLAPKK